MLPVILLLLGIGLGTLLATAAYATELARLARFLRTREAHSNARATVGTGAPGLRQLADAVNAELERSARERIEALRNQEEFQRDLSALSHDIRTPLTGAKGYLQLARDEADTAARTRHLAAAASRIDSTTELLDALFAYTKSADPDLELDLGPVALRPLVERVLVGHYPEFEERGWEPAAEFDDDGARVEADAEALGRILENLVVNAIRHGSGAPSVRCVRDADGRVLLSVENPVADPSSIDVARLFERFYQADSARGSNGSGLGLAVSANLARAMGMELSAALDGSILSVTCRMRRVRTC